VKRNSTRRKPVTANTDGSSPKHQRIHPHFARRKFEVNKSQGRRRLYIATSILAIPAIFVTVVLILHTSLFSVRTVVVHGAVETPSSAIVTAAGLDSSPPLIDVNPIAVAAMVERLPWVAHAAVSRNWPRQVTIEVTERVAIAEANVAKRSWELFDSSGRALGYRTSRVAGLIEVQRTSSMPKPGSQAIGAVNGEIMVADALPLSLIHETGLVGDNAKVGLVAHLPDGTIAIFGSTTSLGQKMNALVTIFANKVSLAGIASVNLTVPSSPILSTS
jgi:cell division protein FtsQ